MTARRLDWPGIIKMAITIVVLLVSIVVSYSKISASVNTNSNDIGRVCDQVLDHEIRLREEERMSVRQDEMLIHIKQSVDRIENKIDSK